MGTPRVYRQAGDPVIASFDFTDIASGTGYNTFYLYSAYTSGADVLRMSNLTPYGNFAGVGNRRQEVGTTKSYETTEFNLPRTLRGEMIWDFYKNINNGSSMTMTGTLFKVDAAGTATTLGNVGQAISGSDPNTTSGESFVMTLPETDIKKGELLRFEVILAGDVGGYMQIDPQSNPTTLKIPFKVET